MEDRRARLPGALSDEALMARYADGDAEAFEELFRRFEPRAYAFYLRRTGSPERAQDLYQELFLRVHRARHRYDAGRPFAPWFFQIASRLLVDDHRRAFRRREVPLGEREPGAGRGSAEEAVASREEIRRALDRLSPEERDAVLSARLEGTAYPELGARLGKSADAVKKMVSRALQRVRRIDDADAIA